MSDRRRFLKVITATATTAALGSACADDESGPIVGAGGSDASSSGAGSSTASTSDSSGSAMTTPGVRAGHVDSVSEGNVKFVTGEELMVGKDAGGVYAMTSLCTHEQCDLVQEGSFGGGRIHCHCHDSEFDYNGAVLVGPASGRLQHYAVVVNNNGIMYVQLDEPVSPDTRTPV
jgi:nitrite reductase/ring-hydroxylating ferredoxin subunit